LQGTAQKGTVISCAAQIAQGPGKVLLSAPDN